MKHGTASHATRLLACVWALACSNHSLTEPGATQRSGLETATWTQIPAPSVATARAASVFVYDAARENCVVFGGRPVDDRGSSLEDTGLWSGDTWVPVAAEYGRRGYVAGAFDSERRRTVVYGGSDGGLVFGDTWEFDGSAWERRAVDSPGNRSGNGLAYDSRRHLTVLFGGYNGLSWKDELWEWDGNTWSQACMTEPCSVGPRPSPRSRAVFVFDEARGVSLLFGGGSEDGEAHGDTWSWDGERWQELHPAHAPLARHSAAATYDPVSQRVLLFGGVAAGLQEFSDFWAWDGNDWTSISQNSMPFARHGAGMAWDAKRRRGILFGGSAAGQETDVWEFQLLGTPCATNEGCHDGVCIEGSCSTDAGTTGGAGGGSSNEGGGSSESGGSNAGGGSHEGGGSSGGGSSSEGGSANAGGVAGEASAAGTAAVEGGAGSGGTVTTVTEGGANDRGEIPAPSGGTATGVAGAVAAKQSPANDDSRSFYSCAFAAPSHVARRSFPYVVVLAILAGWFSRRRFRRSAEGASVLVLAASASGDPSPLFSAPATASTP